MKSKTPGMPIKKGLMIKCAGCGSKNYYTMIKEDGRYPCSYCSCQRVFRNVEKVNKLLREQIRERKNS